MSDETKSPPLRPQASKTPPHHWSPWWGIISLTAILACAVASGIVVGVSHDKEVDTWRVPPAVWLAIFSAGSNVAFSSALATGIAVRFWLHAGRGTQLAQLHYIWEHGRGGGLLQALRAGSTARAVTIMATLAYMVQFSSGPLLQRSTNQANQARSASQTVSVNIASRIPEGWFGVNENGRAIGGRKAMSQAQKWSLNSTIVQPDSPEYRCDGGICTGRVRGAGFTYSCESFTSALDMSNNASAHLATVFLINSQVRLGSTGQNVLQLNVSYIENMEGNCQATINNTICNITAAEVEYPVSVINSTLFLRTSELTSALRPLAILSYPGDSPSAPNGSGAGILGGLVKFISNHLIGNATVRFNPVSNRWLYNGPGTMGDTFFRAEPWDSSNHSLALCGLTWDSPTRHVLTSMHDFLFRVALRVGAGVEDVQVERQRFVAEKTTTVLVFRSDWRYLGAALAVILVGLGLVGALSWGGWRLKRPVTLSPVETAALFVGQDWTGEGANSLRLVLRPGATVNKILAEARQLGIRVEGIRAETVRAIKTEKTGVATKKNGMVAEIELATEGREAAK